MRRLVVLLALVVIACGGGSDPESPKNAVKSPAAQPGQAHKATSKKKGGLVEHSLARLQEVWAWDETKGAQRDVAKDDVACQRAAKGREGLSAVQVYGQCMLAKGWKQAKPQG